jgi:hypothetical protein
MRGCTAAGAAVSFAGGCGGMGVLLAAAAASSGVAVVVLLAVALRRAQDLDVRAVPKLLGELARIVALDGVLRLATNAAAV